MHSSRPRETEIRPTTICACVHAAFREADKAKSIETQAKRAARVQVPGADAAAPVEEEDDGEEAADAGDMEDGDGDGDGEAEADVDIHPQDTTGEDDAAAE